VLDKAVMSGYGGGYDSRDSSVAFNNPLHGLGSPSGRPLLGRGQSQDSLDESNQLPLHAAAFAGRFSVLSELLNRLPKSSLEVRDSNGNSVLHYCVEGGDRSLGCLALLLNIKHVDKDAQNDLGHTALMVAAMQGLENSMQALLLSGVGKNVTDAEGNTALHLAGENRNYRCVELLLANGASTSIKNRRGLAPADVTPQPTQALCSPGDKDTCCTVS
jgi:ankyrin repeat protein